jgi:hypothetical protein
VSPPGEAPANQTSEQARQTLASLGNFQPQTVGSAGDLHTVIQQESLRGPLEQELLRQQVQAMRDLIRALNREDGQGPNTNPPPPALGT